MDLNMRNTEVSKEYSYSYSGSDCRAYAFFDQNEISKIQTLHSEYFKYHKPKINTRTTEQTVLAYPNIKIPPLPSFDYKNHIGFFDIVDKNIVFSNLLNWNILKDNFKININETYLDKITENLVVKAKELLEIITPSIVDGNEVYPAYDSIETFNIFNKLYSIDLDNKKILQNKYLVNIENIKDYFETFNNIFSEIAIMYVDGVAISENIKSIFEENANKTAILKEKETDFLNAETELSDTLNSDLNLYVSEFNSKEEAVEGILVDIVGMKKKDLIIDFFLSEKNKSYTKNEFVQIVIGMFIDKIKVNNFDEKSTTYSRDLFNTIPTEIDANIYINKQFEESIIGNDLKVIDDLIKNIYDNKLKKTDTYNDLFFNKQYLTTYSNYPEIINSEVENTYNRNNITDKMNISLLFLDYEYEIIDGESIIKKSQKELLNDYIDRVLEKTFFSTNRESLLKTKEQINKLFDTKKRLIEIYNYYGVEITQNNEYKMFKSLEYSYNKSATIRVDSEELRVLIVSKNFVEKFFSIISTFNNNIANENLLLSLDNFYTEIAENNWFDTYIQSKQTEILNEIKEVMKTLNSVKNSVYRNYTNQKKPLYAQALEMYEKLIESIIDLNDFLDIATAEIELLKREIENNRLLITSQLIPLSGEKNHSFLFQVHSYLKNVESITGSIIPEAFVSKLVETKKNWYSFIKNLKEHQDAIEKSKITKTIYTEEEYTTYTLEENKPLIDWYNNPVHLDSMATVSVSIHEAKAPVRRLGHRAVSGYTRAIRTIAGSMVFVIVKDHPLRLLAAKDPANFDPRLISWSKDLIETGHGSLEMGENGVKFDNKISTVISPFNLILHYQTETKTKNTNGASLVIEGVEFMNEGIVTSVNDLITEVVVQFVARDIKQFTASDSAHAADIKAAYDNISANATDSVNMPIEYNTSTAEIKNMEYNSRIVGVREVVNDNRSLKGSF